MNSERTNQHVYGEWALWVKRREARLAKNKKLTVILRQGDRSDQRSKLWLPLFEPVPVYTLILGTGDQAKNILPEFEPDSGLTVRIVRRTITRLCDITEKDLIFGTGQAVPHEIDDVVPYLRTELYPGMEFCGDTVLTIYWAEYLEDQVPATD